MGVDETLDAESWYEPKVPVKSVNSEEPLGMEEVVGENQLLVSSSDAPAEVSALGKWMAGFKYAWLLYIALDFANVFKSFIGSNFLQMPFAFLEGGVVGAMVGLFIIATVTYHCCYLVVLCKKELPKSRYADRITRPIQQYGDIGEIVFGNAGKYFVEVLLLFTQTGFCVGYMIFIAENLTPIDTDVLRYILPAVCVLPFIWVKNLSSLGSVSIIANICLIIGIVLCLSFFNMASYKEVDAINWTGLPIFFGVTTASYEGIGLVIPVESSMEKHKQDQRYRIMLVITLLIVTLLLSTFGLTGYLTFADETNSIITENLPDGNKKIATTVCLIIAIFFTYPMQLFPVIEIVENYLWKFVVKRPLPTKYWDWRANLVRSLLCFLTAAIGFCIPFFGLIAALVGALGASTLAFILPCILHLKVFQGSLSKPVIVKDILILVFGSIALVVGTVIALYNIFCALFCST